eukprot:scaffold281_cov318-Pavlova_lutheri.AAC.11
MQGRTISFADLVYVLAFSSDLFFGLTCVLRFVLRHPLFLNVYCSFPKWLVSTTSGCVHPVSILILALFFSFLVSRREGRVVCLLSLERGSRGAQFTHVFVCVCFGVFVFSFCLLHRSSLTHLGCVWTGSQSGGSRVDEREVRLDARGAHQWKGGGQAEGGVAGPQIDRCSLWHQAHRTHPPPHHATLSRPTFRETGTGTKGGMVGDSPEATEK